jgi:hypothetical protein
MLDSLSIIESDLLLDAQGSQEVQHNLVAALHLLRQTRPLVGKKYRPVLGTDKEPLFLQPCYGPIDRHMRHSYPSRYIYQARFSLFFDQIRNDLHVVLRYFMRSGLPSLSMMLCLIGGFTTWTR